jgi:hypothetical protein
MRQAPGLCLTDITANYFYTKRNQHDNLVEVFRQFGMFLADFHKTYHMQHGDCHLSNVFYDEGRSLFTLIDVADVSASPYHTPDDDVSYFSRGLKTFVQAYGADFVNRMDLGMQAGYKQGKAKVQSAPPRPAIKPTPRDTNTLNHTSHTPGHPKIISRPTIVGDSAGSLSFTPGAHPKGISKLAASGDAGDAAALLSYTPKIKISGKPAASGDAGVAAGLLSYTPKIMISCKPAASGDAGDAAGLLSYTPNAHREGISKPAASGDGTCHAFPKPLPQRLFVKAAAATGDAVCRTPQAPVHQKTALSSKGLRTATLKMSSDIFDPTSEDIRSQMVACLNCSPKACFQKLLDPAGSTEGIWLLKDSAGTNLEMRLIRSERKYPQIPTDSEKFATLACNCPDIMSDPSLCFPSMMLKCCEPNGKEVYDLLVIRQAKGRRIAEIVAHNYRQGNQESLVEIFEKLGSYLADFHRRYQMQHGHCNASNVFYDEATHAFTMINLADISAKAYDAENDDVTYFNRKMMALSEFYGSEFLARCAMSLQKGYKKADAMAGDVVSKASLAQCVSRQSSSAMRSPDVPDIQQELLAKSVASNNATMNKLGGSMRVGASTLLPMIKDGPRGVKVAMVEMNGSMLDISFPATRAQILKHVGASPSASIEELPAAGGRSKGMWRLTDDNLKLVLKLVSSKRACAQVPTDAEKYVALETKCPEISKDPSMAFPRMILKCYAPGGEELYDLFVMQQAPGLRMADIISNYYRAEVSRLPDLIEIFRKLGVCLVNFHRVYQMQHGHCHASNVFYDEDMRVFTMINVADMSTCNDMEDDDILYFNRKLMTLSEYYGSDLLTRCIASLQAGYTSSDMKAQVKRR